MRTVFGFYRISHLEHQNCGGGKMKTLRTSFLAVLAASTLCAVSAHGQQGSTSSGSEAANPAPASNDSLVEIIVTAQRRSERLQDVPISITALSAATMDAHNVTSIQDLSASVPGLTFSVLGPAGTPFIRGVGSDLGNPSDEPSVATYIDGVYIASPFSNYNDFNNIDHIEVLKGPQGTLFGVNATGGVIQVLTRSPSQTPEIDASVGYANYATTSGSVYANTPLSDRVAFNIAAQITDQETGWGRNVITDREIDKLKEYSFRSKLLFNLDDATSMWLAADYALRSTPGLNFERPYGFNSAPFGGPIWTLPPYHELTDTIEDMDLMTMGASFHIDHDFGDMRISSITAYRRAWGTDYFNDVPGTTLDILTANLQLLQHDFSQEIHLLSPADSKVQWLIGTFYLDNTGGYDPIEELGAVLSPLTYLDTYGYIRDHAISLFGQTTFDVYDSTKLTLGLRYTHEKQILWQNYFTNFGQLYPQNNATQTFDKPSWRVALDHAFLPDVSGYVSYNRGIKAGGWDTISSPNTPGYKPETLDAYETGTKTEFLDHRVRFNTAAFWYQYKDLQLSHQQNGSSITANAASARIRGLEVELDVVPMQNLTLNLGAAYTNGVYTSFPNANAYASDGAGTIINASGNTMMRTPRETGSAGADYAIPTASGTYTVSVLSVYSSKFFWGPDDRLAQGAYGLLNASLRWVSSDEHLNVKLWGKNLTDKLYETSGTENGFGDLLIYAPPRTYGVTLGTKF